VLINYRRILLRHNLSGKCRQVVKFVSITHSERNIWNGPIVATAILREKRKPVLEGNGCLTSSDNLYAPCICNISLNCVVEKHVSLFEKNVGINVKYFNY